ncbi:hypothetical protein [Xylophilus sp. GOD-11R]|uniref:hypothetical protein n=1 Tax=Xylophilus sp. GOD-11R TaxID=3089814 RepID=UPI00298D3428|nr:hypothetical protein [Xylophilus sp. GOD-11R]WPB57924.1 hypothetical protein R9X41_04570 [Xylophilus sp. GOD-11R]
MGIVEWTAGYAAVGVIALAVLGCYCVSARGGSVIRQYRLAEPQRARYRRGRAVQDSAGDVHLVMNFLNRLAAESGALPEGRLDQICDLADYLRQCLSYAEPKSISVSAELSLVEHYVALIAGARGWQLPICITAPANVRARHITAHSICLIFQTLLHAQLRLPAGTYPIWLVLSEPSPDQLVVLMSIRKSADGLASCSAFIDSEFAQLCTAMSSGSQRWSCSPVRHTDAAIEVSVLIR